MTEKNEEVVRQEQAVIHPSPADIGKLFVMEYYKKLAVNPSEVFQFYGGDSVFSREGLESTGQEEIRSAIEKLGYKESKARIHSMMASNGIQESLVLHVCGEFSAVGKEPPRHFMQCFVLCKQAEKQYYVQNDIFQWLDKAFRHAPIPNKKGGSVQHVDRQTVTENGNNDTAQHLEGQRPNADGRRYNGYRPKQFRRNYKNFPNKSAQNN